ncbi:NAD(P)H-binding protein [Streptomyces aurantiacus]|uniref:NmrA family transcriptional regulator n=1 Tax=Streptomyces aurantiacus TaxID=47760 RepID=A0A7G1NZJ9_9ACTN|nr:NAD(P)H-binding protein [Streptomyces aurantiacus]BCL26997.1 NmrA family transcriptional regulator [Streptomyces aurantiacus]
MIVVTAPTGHIGGQVVRTLLAAGTPVRVVVRDPARLAPDVAERIEIVRGSHRDPAVVAEAFAGADAVFWLVAADPRADGVDAAYSGFARAAVEAFRTQRVARVVGVSVLGRGTPEVKQSGAIAATLAMDDLIAATGVSYRALTMSYFMENTLWQAGPIRTEGVFYGPSLPDRSFPLVATRDIAAVAARLLRDDTWTGSGFGEVPVLGAEDLTHDEMAAVISEVLGRPVRYQRIPGEAYKANLMRNGYAEPIAQGLLDMALAKNNGLDAGVTRTPEFTTPTTFRQWCTDVLKPAVRKPAVDA